MKATKTIDSVVFSVFLLLASATGRASVEAYHYPANLPQAADFKVTADGQPVFIYETPAAAIASFGFSGNAEIHVKPSGNFRHVVIRPLSKNIKPAITNGEIIFTLDAPLQLSLELDGNLCRPLLLFANAPEMRPPNLAAPNLKYFAPGQIYRAGIITLTNNETLYLAGGAIVQGFLTASNMSNIKVRGPGILDFSCEQNKGHSMIELKQCRNVEVRDLLLVDAWGWTFHLFQSSDILIDNLKEVAWRRNSDGIDIDASQQVKINHCFFHNGDDCVVLKCMHGTKNFRTTEDIVVQDCVIWNDATGGNGLEIGYELRGEAVRNVTFRDCDLIHILSGAAISIHNGDYATVENIRYENIRVEDARRALVDFRIGLSHYSSDFPKEYRGTNSLPKPRMDGPWFLPPDKSIFAVKRGLIRNITLQNIQVTGEDLPPSQIFGYDENHQVENVTFSNITLNGLSLLKWPEGRMKLDFATNIQLKK